MNHAEDEGPAFFGDPALDDDLPLVNREFWASLLWHIEQEGGPPPRVLLDIGCHTGGMLQLLSGRFRPDEVIGIEPIASARAAAGKRLCDAAPTVRLLDPAQWSEVAAQSADLITSHEVLYLEPSLEDFMRRVRHVLAPGGVAFVVLGCHAENPLWHAWKAQLVQVGHRVYDHEPMDIMRAAASAGLVPSVQPLRRSGWVVYEPHSALFTYPDVTTMLDHHYRHKLVFRLRSSDELSVPS